MPERIINVLIMFTLSVMAFTLVAFGFDWIYQLWMSEKMKAGWLVPIVAIPIVAVISALLLYLFVSALELQSEDELVYPQD